MTLDHRQQGRNASRPGSRWAQVLAGIDDPEVMRRFLEEMLTPAEQRTMELRWRLMQLLARGVPQRDIASQLGVSLCKITRGARILKREQSVARALLERSATAWREE